jgi:hypothetical protein
MATTLTEEQKQQVTRWVEEGASLAEVQKRLGAEFTVSLTYMETRFLLDDLNLTVKDSLKAVSADLSKAEAAAPVPATAAPSANDPLGGMPAGEGAPGKVRVNVDKVVRPGSVVSGTVAFSDGQSADWYLDQAGRLGLIPKVKGYQPKPGDVQEFQYALQDELARLGY